jgi:hypothetical protein
VSVCLVCEREGSNVGKGRQSKKLLMMRFVHSVKGIAWREIEAKAYYIRAVMMRFSLFCYALLSSHLTRSFPLQHRYLHRSRDSGYGAQTASSGGILCNTHSCCGINFLLCYDLTCYSDSVDPLSSDYYTCTSWNGDKSQCSCV